MSVTATHSAERRAYAAVALATATVAVCAVLMTAAALTPAPPAVIPLVVAVCIGCPLVMAWSLPHSFAMLRAARAGAGARELAIDDLRLHLARLPETEHPLGL